MIRLLPHWVQPRAAPDTAPSASRRGLLGGLAATGAAVALAPNAAAQTAAGGPAIGATRPGAPLQSQVLTFASEWERFAAIMRITRSIEDAADILFWYQHISFVVPIDSPPLPVARFEGMEFTRHERVAEDQYLHHGHNLSYARDLETGAFTDMAVNPVTGRTVRVPRACTSAA